MSTATVEVGQVWEYGHPGPQFKVVAVWPDLVLLEGVRHPAAPDTIPPLRAYSKVADFSKGTYRLITSVPSGEGGKPT